MPASSSAVPAAIALSRRSEEHTSELQSHSDLVCRLLLEKKKKKIISYLIKKKKKKKKIKKIKLLNYFMLYFISFFIFLLLFLLLFFFFFFFFFFNDTATTEIYTLSLHDALPISRAPSNAGSHAIRTPRSM